MSPLPITDWQGSLDEIASALQRTLAQLERFETECAAVLEGKAAQEDRAESTATSPRFEGSVREWEIRLSAATELAASVERDLDERQTEVERWHQSFSRWREMIQQRSAAPHPEPTG